MSNFTLCCKKTIVFACVVLCGLLMNVSGWGQSTANYIFATNTTGSLALDANGNTVDMSTGTTSLVAANSDQGVSAITNIGFDFYLNGRRYNQFTASANGSMALGSVAVSTTQYTITGGTTTTPIMAPLAADMITSTFADGGGITSKVVGTAPNRCLIIQWVEYIYWGNTSPAATWQARLYESGKVEYIYGSIAVGTTAYTGYQTGFTTNATVSGTLASVTTPANSNSTSAIATNTYTANTAVTNLNSAADGSRRIYSWTPVATTAPSGLSFTAVTGSTTNLNWTDNAPDEFGYAIYRSTDNINFTYITTTAANATSYAATALSFGTTYFWKVYAVRESLGTALAGSQATTAGTLSGTKTVGTTGDYFTLTAAFIAINTNGLSGNINIALQSSYVSSVEPSFPIPTSTASAAGTYNVIVYPLATGLSITSSSATGTINMNGAGNLTFDGRVNATGTAKDLQIANTGGGYAIQFTNDAISNTIKYSTIKSTSVNTASGTIAFTATATSLGNSSNTIDNCDILDGATTPLNAIYSSGISTSVPNSGNSITNCSIANYFGAATASNGVYLASNSAAWTISNNKFYQGVTRTATTGTVSTAIQIATASGGGYTISNNTIGYNNASGSGTMTYAGSVTNRFDGMLLTLANTPVSSIQGNTIANISITSSSAGASTSPVFGGVVLLAGGANIGTTAANTIGGTGTGSIAVSGSTTSFYVSGIYVSSTGTVSIKNNVVGSINATGNTAAIGCLFYGIWGLGTGGNFTIQNNVVGSTTTSNSILVGTDLTTTASSSFYGIRCDATGTTIVGGSGLSNTVQNVATRSTSSTFYGYYNGGAAASASYTYNILTGVSQGWTTTASTGTFYGFYNTSSITGTLTISNNSLQNITNLNTTGSVYILYNSSSTATANVQTNTINNITRASTAASGSFYGYYNGSSPTGVQTISSNAFTNLMAGTTTGTASFYGIYNLSSSSSTWNINNNTISAVTVGSGICYGIYDGYGATGSLCFSNAVNNITTAGTIYGIYLGSSLTSTVSCYSNTINNLSSSGSSSLIYGIYNAAITPSIYKNKIYTLAASGAGGITYGIYVLSGTTISIYNNIIGDLTSTLGTQTAPAPSVAGLYFIGGTTINAYYNSVYLSGSGGTNFGTAAVYASVTPTVTLTDNIFINNTTPSGTGKAIAYQRSGTTLTSYSTNSNNNDFYAGAPGVNNLIFYDGTNSYQTIATYKAAMITRDQASFTENPSFQSTTGSSANYLKYTTGTASQLESGGINTGGITDDYTGTVRFGNPGYLPCTPAPAGTAPDVGAWELCGTPSDQTAPSISYVALVNTSCTTNRTTSSFATITDASGVNTTTGTKPRLYYKKSTDANTYAGNTSAGNGWKYVEATNASSPFDFTIDYSLLQSAVITGDIIQYFVVAQDLAPTPNVGINSGTFTAQPASVALTSAAFPIGGTINSYTIVPGGLSGTVTIGTAGTYTSLTGTSGLFADINSKGLSGNLIANIVDASVTETGGVALNQITYTGCVVSTYTVTIKPNTIATLTGSLASGALIKLNGADYVTIDGSNSGGTDKSLTITNTSTTSPTAISLASLGTGAGAINNTIKNCNISTGTTASTTGYGIAVSGGTPGISGADNDNITIQNNTITVANISVYVNGTASASAGGDDNLLVTGNTVTSANTSNTTVNNLGIEVGNALSSTISLNTVSVTTAYSGQPVGISLETGFVSSTVTKNIIAGVTTTATGGYAGRGITIGTGTASSALTVSNNMIYGVNGSNYSSFSNSSSIGIAIGVIGGSATLSTTTGGVNLYYNSISMTGSMGSGSTTAITTALYIGSGATALDLRNNVFSNTQTATSTTQKNYAIYSAAANTAFTLINYNDYYVFNSFNTSSAVLGYIGASDQTTLAAIQSSFGGNVNSINADPQFTSTTNLHVLTSSPVNAKATPITGVTDDIDGQARDVSTPDIGADEFTPPQDDAGITGLTSSSFCPGTQPVQVVLKNYGFATLTSVTINWSVNGIAQTPYNWTGSLASGASTNVTLGTFNFVSATNYTIIATTVSPNGNADANTSNDSYTSSIFQTGLSGTYTVGAGGNYTTLTAAVVAANTNGLCGATVFSLTDASYTTSETFPVTITALGGASSVNTLTIKPAIGISPTISGSSATSILKLNGADYVIIDGSNTSGGTTRNLTISNTSTSSASAVIWGVTPSVSDGVTNNIIKNCIVSGSSGTTTGYGIAFSGATITAAALAANSNNTIQNNQVATVQIAINILGTSATTLDVNNIVTLNNLGTSSLALGLFGIQAQYQSGLSISQNDIQNISSSGSTNLKGIALIESKNSVVDRNLIHKFLYFGGSTTKIYALNTSSGTNFGTSVSPSANIFTNNFIYDISTNCISSLWNTSGINDDGGYGDKFYYNSVYLTASQVGSASSGGYPSAAFSNGNASIATYATALDVRNNIFTITGNSAYSSDVFYAFYAYSSTGISTSTINYNDEYVAVTTGTGYIGYNGSTSYSTLAAWQTATSKDVNSISSDPQFTSTTDLHVSTSSPVDGAATPITGVTTDIDGQARDITTPDIGADEIIAPAYDAGIIALVGAYCSGTNPVVVTLKNYGTTTLTSVTINWTVNGITQTPYNWTGSLTKGSTANVTIGNYTFVAATNYTIIATTSLPNGNTDQNTTNDSYTSVAFQTALNGTYTIGVGQNFTTLTAAVAAANASGLCGPTVFSLTDATYSGSETFPIIINALNGASSTNTLTIKPAAGVSPTISGSSASALLKLNGADYITIDGSNNGNTSKNLTIININTPGTNAAVISLASASASDGATNNIIKNTIITGNSSVTTLMGIFSGGTSIISTTGNALAANSNNTIQNNTISKAQNGIFVIGVSTSILTSGINIKGNTLGSSTTGDGFSVSGIITKYQTGETISGNDIQNIVGSSGISDLGASTIMAGIYIENVTLSTISANKVHFMNYTGTSVNKVYGINTASTFNTSGSPSINIFVNNAVYDLVSSGTSASWNTSGINNNGGYNDKYYYNSVYLSGQMSGSGGTAGSAAFSNGNGINSANCSLIDVRNNIFYMGGSSVSAAPLYTHYTTLTTYSSSTINYNDLYVSVSGSATGYVGYLSSNRITLANWQSATSMETNSISADPLFISTTNLQPTSGSPVVAAATPISGITTDITGTTRNIITPTIGAYETPATVVVINNVSITPTGSQCTAIARTVTANTTAGGTSITSVVLNYSFNGVAQTPVTMTGGTATGTSTWTGTIPAATPVNAVVTWSVTATDGITSKTTIGTSYQDAPLTGITATASATPAAVCTGTSTTLNTTFTSATNPSYTTPSVTNATTDEDLGNITITKGAATILNNTTAINSLTGTIGTATGASGSYSNFTAFGPYSLQQGQVYNFSITSLDQGSPFSHYMYIFIDYNRDGLFTGAGETAYASAVSTSGAHTETGSFTVPASAAAGNLRMRVVVSEAALTGSSTTTSYGEFEDYLINMAPNFTSYTWKDETNATAGTTNPLTITPAATHTYTLSAVDANGCSITSNGVLVTVNPIPAAPTNTTPANQCGLPTFTATSTTSGAIFYWYATLSSSPAITSNTTGSYTPGSYTTGTNTIYVSVSNGACEGPRTQINTNVTNPDVVTAQANGSATPPAICLNSSISLSAVKASGSNVYVYTWTCTSANAATSGISGSVTGSPVSVTPTAAGTYTYLVTAYDAGTTCTTTSSVTITVNALPVITSADASPSITCAGTPVTLTAKSISGTTFNLGQVTEPAANLSSLGGYGMYFSTSSSAIINTVEIYPSTAGTLTVSLKNAGGTTISTNQFTITSADISTTVKKTLALGFSIPAGSTGWQLYYDLSINRGAGTYTYPQSANGFSITGNTLDGNNLSTGTRWYFYNWNITTGTDVTSSYNWVWNPGSLNGSTVTATPVATTVYVVTATDPTTTCSNTANVTVTIASPLSGTYTVGPTGNYTNLTNAVTAYNGVCIGGPITFELQSNYTSGTETFPIIINSNSYASSTNTLTIKPASGVNAVITGNSATAILKLNGADYVTIDGSNSGGTTRNLTISNSNTATTGTVIWLGSASATDGANNNTIKNVLVAGNASTTTFSDIISSSGTTIGSVAETANANNTYQNDSLLTAQYGIGVVGPAAMETGTVISNNSIGSATTKFGFRGIFISNEQGISVTGNSITGVSSANASSTSPSGGIIVTGAISGGSIDKNRITDIKNTNTGGWASYGISLQSTTTTTGITVSNNFISDVAAYGYASVVTDNGFGIVAATGGGYKLYYNSVSLVTNQTATTGYSANFYIASGVTGLDVRNNIFSNTETTGNVYNVYDAGTSSVFTTIDYNDYYYSTGNAYVGYLSSNRVALSDWKTATGQDVNSLNIQPLFVSATDLHLTSCNSGLDGKGVVISGITKDIDGDTRQSPPDIGADEFTSVNAFASINASATTVCAGTPVTLTENGGSAVSWSWSTGAITQSISPSPAVTTTYTVSATTSGCTLTASKIITVNPLPAAATITPSASPTVCYNSIQQLTANATTSGTLFSENFNTTTAGSLPSGWSSSVVDPATSYWGAVASTNAGGTANEVYYNGLDVSTTENGTYYMKAPVVNASALTALNLSFNYYLDNYSATSYPYTLYLQTSTDNTTWTNQWSITPTGTADIPANTVNVNLSALGSPSALYFRFALIGYPFGMFYWYIDNVSITGTQASTNITWSPVTDLYTDATATTAYLGGNASTLYVKPTAPNTYTVTNSNGVCNNTKTVTVSFGGYSWTGNSSTNWNTQGNWCNNTVPTAPVDVTITSVPNQPMLPASVAVHNLDIANNAWVDLNKYTISVGGSLNSATGSTGKFRGSTTSGLVVNGGAGGTAYFDTTNNRNVLKTLAVGSTGTTLTIGDTLNITPGNTADGYGTVTVTGGTLASTGKLVLKSNSVGTARVDISTGTITGNVRVERFIPARRAWRFLGLPYSSSTQYIRDGWQEGVNNPSLGTNLNPNPGFGTHITYNNNSAQGYDVNTTYNTSIKVWDATTGAWSITVPQTINTQFDAFKAYCLFVRGSRAVNLNLGSNATADSTVLRSTGVLNENGVNPSITYTGGTNKIVFVGNPYASSINLSNILTRSGGIDNNKFWVWDPKIMGVTYNVGGYVAYSNGIIAPASSPSYPDAASTKLIESGQAFMVQLDVASTSATMKFQQNDKSASETNVFGRQAGSPYPVIYTNLMAPTNTGLSLTDGVGAAFGNRFSANVDADDAQKLWNFDENIALVRGASTLAIEFRPVAALTDTLFYRLYLRQQPYTLQIFANNIQGSLPARAWIVDKYLNTKTEINLYDTTLYNFTPNTDTMSYRNRFMLVFNRQLSTTPVPVSKVTNQSDPNTTGNGITIAAAGGTVSITPNPVTAAKNAMLRFSNMAKGNYEVVVYDGKGRKLATKHIQHDGSNTIYHLPSGASWSAGVYAITVLNEDTKTVNNLKLVISQ